MKVSSDANGALSGEGPLRSRPGGDPSEGIGLRVAAHRAQRGLRVSELARAVGVTSSLISQIERGQSRPSVSTLFALSEALGVPVDAFFRGTPDDSGAADPHDPHVPETRSVSREVPDADVPSRSAAGADEASYVVRRHDRAAIDIASGVRWERLTPRTLRDVEFLELVYSPRAESNSTLYQHPGTEMVLVLSGELDIYVGFERYHLGPGDSMHFPSMRPHRYVNPTDRTTRAVTTILNDEERHDPPGTNPR
ncbi:MAG: helix-turn-helix domain-containing protein [Actinomycetes bacterium]